MYLGEFRHSLDQKGRLVLPSEMRGQLEEGAVITKSNVGPYLVGFDRAGFENLFRQLSAQAAKSGEQRLVEGRWFATARPVDLDRSGRILLPESLRSLVGLGNEVVVAGAGDHFRLWDAATYESEATKADALVARVIKDVPELNF